MKPTGSQILAEFFNCSVNILNDSKALEKIIAEGIGTCDLGLVSLNSHCYDPIGVTSIAVISESHVAIHTYPEARHASVDIFTCSRGNQKSKHLLDYLERKLMPATTRIVEVSRGNPLEVSRTNWITDDNSAAGFDVRYRVDQEIFAGVSKYQDIKVIDNQDFGRMLFLDNDLQIAERDAYLYNEAMVEPLRNNLNSLSSVAILGGGDGGVLYELLKLNPGRVSVIDIDAEVIRVAKTYLENICHNAFEDERVDIVIEDVFKYLDGSLQFDAMIYDLTMHPESFIAMDRRIYLDQLFEKIKDSLKVKGVLSLQCASEYDHGTIALVENILNRHFSSVKLVKKYIPSYGSMWMFASCIKT
ncbi:MAG: Spermidine synthase [Syntrophus sp. PtaB.Bin001]|nr:MAG: Spermidine synthase [Syntrophus sp. PtaB.Bin001]